MGKFLLSRYLSRWKAVSERGIPLHQYWHDGNPPKEVASHIEAWQAVSGLKHQLFDQDRAAAFIKRHAGARVATCFRSCAVPAMQADLFRYVAIYAVGGIYVDADNTPGPKSLAEFLQTVPVGLLCRRRNETRVWFCNDACYARKPGHPLFRRVIELACDNIEARKGPSVWSVTGPSLFNELNKPETLQLFEGLHFGWYDEEMRQYVKPLGKLAYKQGPSDWRAFIENGQSIYT